MKKWSKGSHDPRKIFSEERERTRVPKDPIRLGASVMQDDQLHKKRKVTKDQIL